MEAISTTQQKTVHPGAKITTHVEETIKKKKEKKNRH